MAHPTDDILKAMQSPTAKDRETIQTAYDFAEKVHTVEKRKSGEPYIVHPAAIALTLAKLGMDRDTIVAGILHDTIEDTPVSADEVEQKFGPTVRFLVEGVTKLSKLKYRGMERHVESLRRLMVATANDIRVIIIKLADRLHNMETIEFVEPVEKRLRIALETKEVYVPIAARLGIGVIKAQLEDLAFKTLEPEEYKKTKAYLEKEAVKAEEAFDETIKELRRVLAEAGIKNFRTEYRVKNAHSFAAKLKRKGDADKIMDVFAIRIIVPSVEDCYKTLGVIHSVWRPVPDRVKDYIANPKPNGYKSLHTTIITRQKVIIELQIRSEGMQRESKFGIASHFLYKDRNPETGPSFAWAWQFIPSLMRIAKGEIKGQNGAPTPRWLSELNEAASEFREHSAFQKALKEDFFAERMFVYTPKGDVIDLPKGATPIDFAYAIHSDIGNTMTGALVNKKMVQLTSELKNGDIVEIVTKKSAKPNKKWLEYAKTSGAKHHIRNAMNRADAK